MYRPFALLLLWVLMFAATIAVILVDRRRRASDADFAERGIGSFLPIVVLTGPIALVVYFYTTQRSRRGLLMGLRALLGVLAGGALAGAGLFLGARSLEGRDRLRRDRETCSAPAIGDGDLGCLRAAERYLADGAEERDPALGQELLEAGCGAGHLDACIRLAQLWESGALGREDRAQATVWLAKGKEICAKRPAPSDKCRAVERLAGRPDGAVKAP